MRYLAALLLIVLAASCGHAGDDVRPDTPSPHERRLGAPNFNGYQGQWVCGAFGQAACPAVAGNATTVVVFGTTTAGDKVRGLFPGIQRVQVRFRFNQATTVLFQTLEGSSTTWRTANGSGSGDSVSANTDYTADFLVSGPDVRVAVTTGVTGPTTREEAVQVFLDRTPGS